MVQCNGHLLKQQTTKPLGARSPGHQVEQRPPGVAGQAALPQAQPAQLQQGDTQGWVEPAPPQTRQQGGRRRLFEIGSHICGAIRLGAFNQGAEYDDEKVFCEERIALKY